MTGERRSENLENLLETPAVISQLNTSPVRKLRGSHIQHTYYGHSVLCYSYVIQNSSLGLPQSLGEEGPHVP